MDPLSQLKPYYLLLSISLLQQCHRHDVKAVTTISHPRTASVCSGDQLELTCTSTRNILRWRISIPNGTVYDRALTAASQEWQIQNNLTTFTFSVISDTDSLMLISRLLVSPLNDGLNRTEVSCVDDDDTSLSTINIISKTAYLGAQETSIGVRFEQYESSGVTTILEWAQEHSLYSYYVTVTPDAALWINGSASVNLKLKVPYSVLHNVSVVSIPPCGQATVTRSIELFYSYGFCGNPAGEVLDDGITITLTGHTIPIVIGTNVTFSCMPGLIQIGPKLSMCMGNGDWEPDPKEVHCIAIGKATEVMIDLDEQQPFTLSQNGKIAIASATVFGVTLIIGFVIGFLCGHFCKKQRKTLSPTPQEKQTALQDDLVMNQTYENALELQENASYASIK